MLWASAQSSDYKSRLSIKRQNATSNILYQKIEENNKFILDFFPFRLAFAKYSQTTNIKDFE
jgi:hypothetical protein